LFDDKRIEIDSNERKDGGKKTNEGPKKETGAIGNNFLKQRQKLCEFRETLNNYQFSIINYQ